MTISHIDMPVALSRKETTAFGQPMLDDYGMDDLSMDLYALDEVERADALLPDVRAFVAGSLVKGEPRTESAIVALMDPSAPAKTVHKHADKPTHTLVEPDMVESGMAWWIGDDAIVACPIEMLDKAMNVAMRGGWFARNGEFPCERGFMVQPLREGLVTTGVQLSKHKGQYDEWRAVEATITKEA